MKQLIPLLALVMLLKPLWPIVDYVINYEYIVENLCENRDQPMMNCDGKCFLAKQLAKETEKKEKNPFSSKFSDVKIPIVNYDDSQALNLLSLDSEEHNYKTGLDVVSYLLTSKMLRPPETV